MVSMFLVRRQIALATRAGVPVGEFSTYREKTLRSRTAGGFSETNERLWYIRAKLSDDLSDTS